MNEFSRTEELLTEIINLLSEEFGEKFILRGGMVMRLLDSPRMTSDLDCLFVPFKSKNDIVELLISALGKIEGAQIDYSLNSKCLRCFVSKESELGTTNVQVEAKVSLNCKTDVVSTASLSKTYSQIPKVVRVMAHEVSMANKLAAWYERRLIRDLYDVYLFINMGVQPDEEILIARFKKPLFARNVKNKVEEEPLSLDLFYSFLKQEIEKLSFNDFSEQLRAILPSSDLLNLDMKVKAAILSKL